MENTLNLSKKRDKKFWLKKLIFIPIAIAAGIFVFGSVVMLLWNAILPDVLGVKTITFWQAFGILILSKILFGGFPGEHDKKKFSKRRIDFSEKLQPEEREKIRKEWCERFTGKPKQEQD